MSTRGLQVHVLGELTATLNGRPLAVPGSRKTRALLGFLLLQRRPVTREHLCELLWPHPDNPRAALRWSLTKLRPFLDDGVQHLVADRTSVAIEGLAQRVDLVQVDGLLARPLDSVETPALEAAAALFRGELLEGLEIPDCHRFNEWLIARAEAARKARRTILETLTARLADDPEEALVHARALVALDPLDEGAHAAVVRLLGTLGRVNQAHEQADRCRRILDRELGVAPGPRLAAALGTLRKPAAASPVAAPALPSLKPRAAAPAGLFGRADECVQLEDFLSAGNWQRVLVLEGEPGIGKSRLLAELQRRAESRKTLFLSGRSWEVEMVRPYGVWIDLLAGLPHELVPDELRADLTPLIPSLGEPRRADGAQDRLLEAMDGLVTRINQAGRPLVLVFDDIHWIDAASVELLGHLGLGRTDHRFGIACAGRPGELADNEAARALMRSWNRQGRLQRMTVEPLADRDAAALARSMAATDDVEDLVASCGGNPLYLIESAREGPGKAMGAVHTLVADRLDACDDATRAVARWAAVLGHAFPAARLADLLSQPLPELLDRTAVLERHGILRPHGDAWDVAHDLLRRSLLADISSPRRTLMHRHIARAMAAETDPTGALAGEVSFHASRGAEPELAARAAVEAGDRALRLAAFDAAWRTADRGLRQAEGLPDDLGIALQVELLRIRVLASRGRRDGQEIAGRLADLADRAHAADLPAAEHTARWLLSVVTEEAGDLDAARGHSLDAESVGRGADPRTRLQALANTARCLVQLEREPARAGELLQEAQALANTLQARVMDLPWGAGLLCAMQGRTREAREELERAAAMAQAEENHWARFECLSRLSMLDLDAGDTAAVLGRDAALREVAGKLGEGSEAAVAATLLALARRKAGDPEDGLDLALEALRTADSKGLLAYGLNEAGRLDLADGDADGAAGRAAEALVAAAAVGRHHQHDRAMWLAAQAALVLGDDEAMDQYVHWLEERLEHLDPGLPIHDDLRRLGGEIKLERENRE